MTWNLIFLGAQILYAICFVLLIQWGNRLLGKQTELMKIGQEGSAKAVEQWREAQRHTLLTYEALEKATRKLQEKISN